jgi:hypothetical protein
MSLKIVPASSGKTVRQFRQNSLPFQAPWDAATDGIFACYP